MRRGEKPSGKIGVGRRGHRFLDERHRVVDEDPGRRTVGAPEDASAVRVPRGRPGADHPESRRIDPDGMPVHAPRRGRTIGQRRIEVYSPKLKRRVTLFSWASYDAWLLLEADPAVDYCNPLINWRARQESNPRDPLGHIASALSGAWASSE